jgi:Tol biopolymer transport system component
MQTKTKVALAAGASIIALVVIVASMQSGILSEEREVPREGTWGIYSLTLSSEEVSLVYSSDNMLKDLSLNGAGDRLAFSERIGGTDDSAEEICCVYIDGTGFSRLTDNDVLDTYPAWSSDEETLYFLSWRDTTLDIYSMGPDGSSQALFYDSGFHDADVHSVGDTVVFTRESRVWSIGDDATGEVALTDPPMAGEWGDANLPFGDYDPRLSPDGGRIVFERLVDDESVHGNYDLYMVDADGTDERALTSNGYSQGLASWSHSGDRIAYIVAAIDGAGVYRIYMMDSDGTGNGDATPDYFPDGFLCHSVVFSKNDSRLFFIGQWW